MSRVLSFVLALFALAACQTESASVAGGGGGGGATPAARPAAAADPLFPDLPRAVSPRPSGACYNESEIRAEEMVRLRTQMMLAGLTCRGSFGAQDVFAVYQTFIVAQQASIRDAQNTIGRMLSRYQGGSPGRLYDTFQTQMANNEQRQLLNHGAGNFCFQFENKFNRAAQFSPTELNSYLDRAVQQYQSDYPSC